MKKRLAPWLVYWPYVALAIMFVASRLVYRRVVGIRFDSSLVFYFIQYVDPWFYDNHLFTTIVYQHQQAPFQNLLVGGAWRLLGPYWSIVFLDALYVTLGFTAGLALLHVMLRLGVRKWLAAVATTLFVVAPVTVLYENFLFYPIVVVALLLYSLVALLRYYRLGTLGAGLLFFSVLAVMALFRNVYGPLWMSVIAAALLLRPPVARAGRSARRILVKAAVVPIVLVALNGAKTSVLTGHGYGEAAVWANLFFKTFHNLPAFERQRLLDEGLVSGAVKYEPFSGLSTLYQYRVEHEPTGVPLLDMAKSPSGAPNHHTLEYVLIVDTYYKPGAKYVLRHYPEVYARAVWDGLSDWYFASPTRDLVMPRTTNHKRIRKFEGALNRAAGADERGRIWALVIALPIAFLYGLYRLLRPSALRESERSSFAVILFMTLTIAYTTAGTTMVSYGDFSRYRFDIDAFYLILGVLFVQHAGGACLRFFRGLRERRRRPVASPADAGALA